MGAKGEGCLRRRYLEELGSQPRSESVALVPTHLPWSPTERVALGTVARGQSQDRNPGVPGPRHKSFPSTALEGHLLALHAAEMASSTGTLLGRSVHPRSGLSRNEAECPSVRLPRPGLPSCSSGRSWAVPGLGRHLEVRGEAAFLLGALRSWGQGIGQKLALTTGVS